MWPAEQCCQGCQICQKGVIFSYSGRIVVYIEVGNTAVEFTSSSRNLTVSVARAVERYKVTKLWP
jgi:hypothetical protein